MASIRVVAHLPARKDTVEAVKAAFLSGIEPTRAEKGCIRYELLQSTTDPTDFTFVEEWASKEALDEHMKTPHIAKLLQAVGDKLGGAPDIRTYTLLK